LYILCGGTTSEMFMDGQWRSQNISSNIAGTSSGIEVKISC